MQTLSVKAFSDTSWLMGVKQGLAWGKTADSDKSYNAKLMNGMVDRWTHTYSHEDYFDQCMTQENDEGPVCTYSEEREMGLIDVLFAFIAVSAGFFTYTRGFVNGLCFPAEGKALKKHYAHKESQQSDLDDLKSRVTEFEHHPQPQAAAPVGGGKTKRCLIICVLCL